MHVSRTLLVASVLALPLLPAEGQARRRAGRDGGTLPPISASALLDARRELELTPRQVARLDSIERSQVAQRRSFMEQMTRQRDSVCANRNPCRLSGTERDSLRARMARTRGGNLRQSDSAGRSLALAVLDSTQRGKVQGWRIGERRNAMVRNPMQGPRGARGSGRAWHDGDRRRQWARPGDIGRDRRPRRDDRQ
ncbi:MAG: hypothetical protein IT361_15300 [Gemmatimonadaceae bacterium]|nr:hypothetical protein [Gemmatimonadaceae bacterium]